MAGGSWHSSEASRYDRELHDQLVVVNLRKRSMVVNHLPSQLSVSGAHVRW